MIEVQLVNSVAPLLCNRLGSDEERQHRQNTSSSMFLLWKASLRFQGRPTSTNINANMLTHTAGTLAKGGIL
jgi:hypothetical protein